MTSGITYLILNPPISMRKLWYLSEKLPKYDRNVVCFKLIKTLIKPIIDL